MSRFDAVPIPEPLRKNLSPKAIMEIPVETAWSMFNFRADEVVANIAPRPRPHVRKGGPADGTDAHRYHRPLPARAQ
jgi:hypothetical protein